LSASVTMASASASFFLIWLTVLISFLGVIGVCLPLCCLYNLWRLWAT
jgi:hypothetical protein